MNHVMLLGDSIFDNARTRRTQWSAYSDVSSIEPSALGGAKIADAIARAVTGGPGQSAVYC